MAADIQSAKFRKSEELHFEAEHSCFSTVQHFAILTSSRLNAGNVGTDLLGSTREMQRLWMLQVTFAQQALCATRSHILRLYSEFLSESAQSQRLAASVQRS